MDFMLCEINTWEKKSIELLKNKNSVKSEYWYDICNLLMVVENKGKMIISNESPNRVSNQGTH